MSDNSRLLPSNLLPTSLWDRTSKTLQLPPIVADAYRKLIDRNGLRSLAESRDPTDPPVGGISKEQTDRHFAQAFDGSVARAQMAVIDPTDEVSRASNAFIRTLSGNRVSLTDSPCGAGAASFAFLASIAELRAQNVLPRIPLDVYLIGADISVTAREYADAVLQEIRPYLEKQAIFVSYDFVHWDVTDKLVNADLISLMTRKRLPADRRLLVVANFSAWLSQGGHRDRAEHQLEELFRFSSGDDSVTVWIEPKTNRAIHEGGIFSGIIKWVTDRWYRFVQINLEGDDPEPVLTAECMFQDPLFDDKRYPVRLSVMRLDLVRSE